jgi:hypothetical protein
VEEEERGSDGGIRQRTNEMTEFLNEQPYELKEYEGQLVRRLNGKVTVFEETISVEF